MGSITYNDDCTQYKSLTNAHNIVKDMTFFCISFNAFLIIKIHAHYKSLTNEHDFLISYTDRLFINKQI